jgi:hypothetical protein
MAEASRVMGDITLDSEPGCMMRMSLNVSLGGVADSGVKVTVGNAGRISSVGFDGVGNCVGEMVGSVEARGGIVEGTIVDIKVCAGSNVAVG